MPPKCGPKVHAESQPAALPHGLNRTAYSSRPSIADTPFQKSGRRHPGTLNARHHDYRGNALEGHIEKQFHHLAAAVTVQ